MVRVLWRNIEAGPDDWIDQPPDGPMVVIEVRVEGQRPGESIVKIEWEWG
jgi:hypothetical protein